MFEKKSRVAEAERKHVKSCVKNALCYCGAECWALKKDDDRKLQTTEMKMLHTICGKRLRDGLSNARTREMTGLEKAEKFLRSQKT